ncbi:hypothetical protein Dimus_025526 [Dionaea muscipula]
MLNTATSLPELLHCLNATTGNGAAAAPFKGGADMSVLERQRAVLKWKQEQLQFQLQQQQCYFNELNMLSVPEQAQSFQDLMSMDGSSGLGDMILSRPMKQDPRMMENGWPEFGSSRGLTTEEIDPSGAYTINASCGGGGYGVNFALSRTTSCPADDAMKRAEAGGKGGEKLNALAGTGRESFKKRKPDKSLPTKVEVEEDNRPKKLKECGGENIDQQQNCIKNTNEKNTTTTTTSDGNNENKNNREASGCTSKANSKASDQVQKPDYIHVRARRGQATDSHSLAERVRREKISERMKYLQDLVPGCNKITGKAGMLDEIINYVQSLQRQVEFLSMKLAAVNPSLDFNIEDLFTKEVLPACLATQLPTMGVTPDIVNRSHLDLQYNPVPAPLGPVCSSDIGVNPVNINLRRSINAPLSVPETFPDLSGFNQIHSNNALPWEAELQNMFATEFQQARPNSFPPQTYTGSEVDHKELYHPVFNSLPFFEKKVGLKDMLL